MKDKYIFKGTATDSYDKNLGYYELATYAASRKRAINNFKYQIKKILGLNASYAIYISESCVRLAYLPEHSPNICHMIDDSLQGALTSDIQRCEICGTPLTDSGRCPKCDDGEEDY